MQILNKSKQHLNFYKGLITMSPPKINIFGQTQKNSATSLSINLFPILVWHPFRFIFQINIQLLLDQNIHNFVHCHLPKLFVQSNFSTSNLALETIVLTTKGFVEDFAKAFQEEIVEDFVEESLDIFLPKNQIHKPITKISKENKSKCLGSEPWLWYFRIVKIF